MFRSAYGARTARDREASKRASSDQPGREESAAATDPPTGSLRDMYAITRRDENPQRGVDLLALECRVERIGEQDDFRTRLGTIGFTIDAERIRTPRGQASLGGKP